MLLLLTLAQKHWTVPGLQKGEPAFRSYHSNLGYLTTTLMMAMSISGFFMRDTPVYSSFPAAMWLFFLPWPLIASAILFSAWTRSWNVHGIAGNVALKACLSVPMARVVGGVLQRNAGGRDWMVEQLGYYVGIGMTAAVVGVWALWDVRAWWIAMRAGDMERKKR
jgi:hypothetical protein